MTSKLLLASLLPLAIATVPLAAQSSINLPPSPDSARITGFGKPGFTTIGQTFTVPTGNATVLQSFQFYLGNDRDFGGNGGGLFFKAYLAAFDSTNAMAGPILFQSATAQGNPLDTFAPYKFLTGGVTLNPGTSYIAFLSAAGIPTIGGDAFDDLEASDATYASGSLVFQDSGDDTGAFTRDPFLVADGINAAFSAQFTNASTVPEPSEFVLLVSGLSGLGGIVRLRRRRVVGA